MVAFIHDITTFSWVDKSVEGMRVVPDPICIVFPAEIPMQKTNNYVEINISLYHETKFYKGQKSL